MALLADENRIRSQTDFAALPRYADVSGDNPLALAAGPQGDVYVGLMDRPAIVPLRLTPDKSFRRDAAVPVPAAESLCIDGRYLYAVGKRAKTLTRLDLHTQPPRVERFPLPGAVSPRRVVCRSGQLFILDEDADMLEAWTTSGAAPPIRVDRVPTGRWPAQIAAPAQSDLVVVGTALSHELQVFRFDGKTLHAVARAQRKAPIFSLAARVVPSGATEIFVGTLEERELDRTRGFFAHIDSVLARYVYREVAGAAALSPPTDVNLSEHGVVTPSALLLTDAGTTVYGRGSAFAADIDWRAPKPKVTAYPTMLSVDAALVTATHQCVSSVLRDAVTCNRREKSASTRTETFRFNAPPDDQRLGEALFFTAMMAPGASADGDKSRFSCETCHFEGYFDGRTHFTGREDIHATSKPLRGLWNNRPHFSRALDANVAVMVDAEFNVANAGDKTAAWFGYAADHPAYAQLGRKESATPRELRAALMTFLRAFTFEANPYAQGRTVFTAQQSRGADLFARRCERCHTARTVADVASSRLPQGDWAAAIFGPGHNPIVFGRDGYEKTGVTPYVHDSGARPPSLRRVYKKWPYFTDGSARSLSAVVEAARFDDAGRFWHRAPSDVQRDVPAPPPRRALTRDERDALLAFLKLL